MEYGVSNFTKKFGLDRTIIAYMCNSMAIHSYYFDCIYFTCQ